MAWNPGYAWQMRVALAVVTVAAAGHALAQPYPERPVRVIVAQSAGSSMDTITRIVTSRMAEQLGQPFVIDNRGGASGIIGVELAARATPDGYTLLIGAPSSMIIANFTYRSLPFDWRRDFAPISPIVDAEGVLVVHPVVAARSVKELLAMAKAQPGKLNMASAGVGSSSHLAGVLFTSLAGIESVHVPYKGGGPVAAAIIAGETHWTIVPAAAVVAQVKAGRLRALGVSTAKRSPVLPELPTIAEAGVPGYEYNAWNGVFAPKDTPRAIVSTLHIAFQKALAGDEVKRQYADQGLTPQGSDSPQQFAAFMRADYERIARLVKIAGIKPE